MWVILGAKVTDMTSLYMPAFHAIIAEFLPSGRRSTVYRVYNTITRIPKMIAPLLDGILVDTYGLYRGVRMFL